MAAPLVTLLLVLGAVVPTLLTNGPPADPTNAAECATAGGECVQSTQCTQQWKRPFPNICGQGLECCFNDFQNHRLRCGLFGGSCGPAQQNCGIAQHRNAYCPGEDQICCAWLF